MEIELSGSGDQQNAIQGASYLQDIGDWHNKNVQGSMIIQGQMLRDIRLGSKTEPIVISISSLTISNCVSLQRLLLSNISTLAGTLNLAACTHLQEVHADGTSLVQVILPAGGGLRTVEFSAYNQYLTLANYPLMTNEGVGIDLCKGIITDFFVVDCPRIDPMRLLVDIMNTQDDQGGAHALKRIRAVGFDENYESSEMLDKLAQLADGSYSGLSSEGLSGEDDYPVLDGTLNINANCYEDSIEALKNTFKKLVLNITGEYYTRFKDSFVQNLIATHYGDGIGTKIEQIKIVSSFDGIFRDRTEIKSFDEFELFIGYTTGAWDVFSGCLSLRSVKLPLQLKIVSGCMFYGCEALNSINLENIEEVQRSAFYKSGLETVILDNVVTLGASIFSTCQRLSFVRIGNRCETLSNCFWQCTSLTNVDLGNSIKLINYEFQHSPLNEVIIRAVVPPMVVKSFQMIEPTCKFYVPDTSVDVYKTASNWSQYANKIYPLSEKI